MNLYALFQSPKEYLYFQGVLLMLLALFLYAGIELSRLVFFSQRVIFPTLWHWGINAVKINQLGQNLTQRFFKKLIVIIFNENNMD